MAERRESLRRFCLMDAVARSCGQSPEGKLCESPATLGVADVTARVGEGGGQV